MTSTLTRGRNRTRTSSKSQTGINSELFAAMLADFEMKVYGAGQAPLYDMIAIYGKVESSNTIDSAYQTFEEIKSALEIGGAGYCYSYEFNQFTLALKVDNGGIVFASLLHDQNGSPRADEDLVLCRVKANRDFEFNGETIIAKDREFIKALPESYLSKMKKVA